MRCLAVCQDELVIRMLDEILLPGFEVEFIVENRPLARRLHEAGVEVMAGDPRRTDTFVKADLGPSTCVIIEDNGRRSPRRILEAVRDAGGTLIYVLGVGAASTARRADEFHADFPDVAYLAMSELFGGPLLTEFSRSLTRARVHQYQRYFSDADRVLIMLHNDPDPDALASGLALRNILRRTKTTAIIGAIQGVTRPENLRMVNMLDIHVEPITAASLRDFDRVAMVDVQPHYFGGAIDRVDLVIDHHPEQVGYTTVFKDIRADYGSTCTILTEHLRAVDVNISERTATAMLYAIKSDTLFFNRQTNRVDIEAFSYLYPLADAAMIRKMEGAEITLERLDYVTKARASRHAWSIRCSARFIGQAPREDFITYVADFFLQVEDVKWTIIAGVVNDVVRRLSAQPRLLEERRRVRAPLLRGHRQRRWTPRDGERRRCRCAPSARSSATSTPSRSASACRNWSRSFCTSPARTRRATSRPLGRQRPVQVGNQVFDVLEPDRQPQHAARHTRLLKLLVGMAAVRGQRRHAHQALDAAKAGGAPDDLQTIEDRCRPVEAACQVEADHAAESGHLTSGDRVVGMRRQARIPDLGDAPVLRQELGHRLRARVVAGEAQRQGLEPALQRVGRKRIDDRAQQAPDGGDWCDMHGAAGHHPANHVAVAIEVLGRALHRQVDP